MASKSPGGPPQVEKFKALKPGSWASILSALDDAKLKYWALMEPDYYKGLDERGYDRGTGNLAYFMGVEKPGTISYTFEYPENFREALIEITENTEIDHPRGSKKFSRVTPISVKNYIEAQVLENGEDLQEVLPRYADCEGDQKLANDIAYSLNTIDEITGKLFRENIFSGVQFNSFMNESQVMELEDALIEHYSD